MWTGGGHGLNGTTSDTGIWNLGVRYGWVLTLSVSIGLQIITYMTFEKWFLVPLPKGPLEELLGL